MTDENVTYLSMPTGIIFCSECPYTKIGKRKPIVVCVLGQYDSEINGFEGEGRCEDHKDIPFH